MVFSLQMIYNGYINITETSNEIEDYLETPIDLIVVGIDSISY